MSKKPIRVSDAIPEIPYSFEQTVERTLNRVCAAEKTERAAKTAPKERWTPQDSVRTRKTRQKIGTIITYTASAILLIAVLGVGGVLLRNAFRRNSISHPASEVTTEPPQATEANLVSTVQTHSVTIQLIPDFDDPQVYEKAREEAHQPAFSEEDWGWIRKIGVTVENVAVNDREIRWTTVFSIPPEIQPERFSQNPFTLGTQENGMTLFGNGTELYWNGVMEDLAYSSVAGTRVDLNTGIWYVEETTVMTRPETDFSGIAEVHQQFRMQDSNVDPQQPIATIALIQQTFTFSVTPVQDPPHAIVPAICYDMLLYTMSDVEFAGEIDESAIIGRVSSVVPRSEWPQTHGEANFGKIGMPYAETENGLVVLYENEWRLMEPWTPDPAAGVIDAACAQVLAEREEIDERYRHTGTMTEEEIGDLDAEANFNHQRLVRLMNLWANEISVEQSDGMMRLSQIAPVDGSLTFAFAAPLDTPFDEAPVIRLNRNSYATGNMTAFFHPKSTETEQYAFCEIQPGQLSGVKVITVENAGHFFCFRYDADSRTVTLPKDEGEFAEWFNGNEDAALQPTPAPTKAAPVPSVRYNGTVYLLTDETFEGETIQMLATIDGIETSHIPNTDNHANFGEPGMVLALTKDGLVIYNSGSCKRLEPMLAQRDGPAVSGMMVPAIRYQGILYLLAESEDARLYSTAGEYITYSIASSVPPNEWPTEEEQINFDWLGAKVSETKNGLIVEKDGELLLFRPTYDIPAVFRVKGSYVVPSWNFLSNPEGDGKPIAWVLEHDDEIYSQIPFVEYRGGAVDVVPRGYELERIYLLNAKNEQIAERTADKLELMEACYAIPDSFFENLAPGVYTLSAVMTQRDGSAVTSYECVIRIQIGE